MKIWLKALLLSAFLSLPMTTLAGPTPEGTVDVLNAGLLAAMKEPEAGYQARFDRLDPLMQAAFDYDHMAEIAVGKYWSSLSEAERTRYLDLFTKISVAAAASRFREKSGVTLATTGTRPGPQGTTLVDTTLKVDQGEARQITYLLRDTGGDWRAVDVYYEGTVSELATKRSEYTSVIKMQGVDGLFAAMEKKLADYAKN
jgi:phospholipid transport system substrate-binding protein